MIKIFYTTKIDKIEEDWKNLERENSDIDPMCHFEFVKKFAFSFTNKLKRFISRQKIRFYTAVENDKTLLIMPVVETKTKLETLYTLDFFDIISQKDISSDKFYDCLKLIANTAKKDIVLQRFREGFNTAKKLAGKVEFDQFEGCVKIDYNDNYDDYYNGLTKNARQNLRTAYNRASTDNYEVKFEFHQGKIKKELSKQLEKLYIARLKNKNKKFNFAKEILYKIDEPIGKVCFNLDNSFTSVVFLNDNPVAYMSGIISKDEVIVPRLAINDKYARYSVGIILVNETVKHLINAKINTLNLAVGTEKYKTQMGGGCFYNLKTTIKTDK